MLADVLEPRKPQSGQHLVRLVADGAQTLDNWRGLPVYMRQRALEIVDHGQPGGRPPHPLRLSFAFKLSPIALSQVLEVSQRPDELLLRRGKGLGGLLVRALRRGLSSRRGLVGESVTFPSGGVRSGIRVG
jgi:hypothetical protein